MTSEKKNNLVERPPVVVIMGHIDHGKSTLLDYIRKSNIVAGEAGGITQHIAAYEVNHETADGIKRITFLDTPGHEAFSNVRSRGASVADIAVLIVSAEDGVMPQTKEALQSIKKDNTPFIVAINKIDSPKADLNRTKSSLIENEIYIEGMGGNISFAEISAKTGAGVNDLLDLILLAVEIEELRGDPSINAEGIIVESHKDKQTGNSATLIIKNGTLKKGMFVAGKSALSPVRAIIDQNSSQIESALFSTPVTISGWNEIPPVGEVFKSFDNKKDAEAYCEECMKETPKKQGSRNIKADANSIIIPLVIKTDVQGTADAIEYELKKVNVERVSFNIIKTGIGNISENDMKLAVADPNTTIVGFNVGTDMQAEALRERDNINTKTFSIIYELTNWLKEVALEKQPRIEVDEIQGKAKVLKIFNKDKHKQVIGAKVKEGTISVGDNIRILRRDEEVGKGVVKGIQQQKSASDSVSEGSEFGSAIEARMEIAEGDYIESVRKIIK